MRLNNRNCKAGSTGFFETDAVAPQKNQGPAHVKYTDTDAKYLKYHDPYGCNLVSKTTAGFDASLTNSDSVSQLGLG